MNIKNIFLVFIVATVVTTCFCTVQENNEPYAINNGFDTLLCPDYGITIRDALKYHTLKEYGCQDLQEVFVVTLIRHLDGAVFVVGMQLGEMKWRKRSSKQGREIVSLMKEDIFNNVGIIFPGKIPNKAGTKLLPIIILRSQDVTFGEILIEQFLLGLNANSVN